jgi:hypothetical protein
LAKILRGVTQLNFDRKAKLDFDRKKQNWILTKKMHNYVLKKIKKNKKKTAENTVLTPTRRQKPTHKAQRRRVCVSTTVPCNEKKSRSSVEQKEVN